MFFERVKTFNCQLEWFRPRVYFRREKINIFTTESLILAQDERWRRA
jgi:hypothetical protein